MDFFDNVVNKSNALIKERLNNPFGTNKQTSKDGEQDATRTPSEATQSTTTTAAATNDSNDSTNRVSDGSSATGQATNVTSNPTTTNSSTNQQQDTQSSPSDDSSKNNADKNSQFAAMAADAEAVAQKAAQGAKNFGTFLFSMANKAGQHVTQTAKQVKQVVENTSILTDFTREQQEFIKEHGGSIQAGQLPWDELQDESKSVHVKEQVLSLSQDKRNFVRSPPNDAKFVFDSQKCYPIALSLLKEDPNLGKMRYELVPKLVNEDTFWRNYFYRVSMVKQMSEKGQDARRGWSSSRSSSGEGPDEVDPETNQLDEPVSPGYQQAQQSSIEQNQQQQQQQQQSFSLDTNKAADEATSATTTEDTTYQAQELESSESRKLFAEADDLKSKLKELNIGSLDEQDDNEKWEEELQRDMQEFELVSPGDVSSSDEEALAAEIAELKSTKPADQKRATE